MLKKLAAVLLLVGLVLPFRLDTRPLTDAWVRPEGILMVGIPVLVAIAYALHTFLPPLARFHERNGPAFHGLFRVVYFVLAGMLLHAGVSGERAGWPSWVAALVATGAVLYWSQGRATKAQRLPLLLLMVVGLPVVHQFLAGLDAGILRVGAWVLTAGWALAVGGEVSGLRGTATVSHGG